MKTCLPALVALLFMGQASASDMEPFQLIRQLQDLQNGLSVGVSMPDGASERLLKGFVDAARDPATAWSDRRNRSALVFYLLTGGDPEPLAPVLSDIAKNRPDRGLIEAAFAHARPPIGGKSSGPALAAIDPREVAGEAAAVIALAQARVLFDTDRPSALQKLRAARMLAPGGFIEDAALRQELMQLDANSDVTNIQQVAMRYLNRFPKSLFAGSFIRRLEALCGLFWQTNDPLKRADVAFLLEELPSTYGATIALSLARSALIKGEMASATPLVKAGCTKSTGIAGDDERCGLYSRLIAGVRNAAPPAEPGAPGSHLDLVDRLLAHCGAALFHGDDEHTGSAPGGVSEPESDLEQGESDLLKRVRARADRAKRLLSGAL